MKYMEILMLDFDLLCSALLRLYWKLVISTLFLFLCQQAALISIYIAWQRDKFLDILSIFEYFIDLGIHEVEDHEDLKRTHLKFGLFFIWVCLIRSISCRIGQIQWKDAAFILVFGLSSAMGWKVRFIGGMSITRWAKCLKMDTKEDAEVQEERPPSPMWALHHLSEEAFRVAGEALHNVYSGHSNFPPMGPEQGHRRSQSEVVTKAHRRNSSFQRLKSQMQKAWKWGSDSREEDYRRSFNPEVLANHKRQWYQLQSKSMVFYLNSLHSVFYNLLGLYVLWDCKNFKSIWWSFLETLTFNMCIGIVISNSFHMYFLFVLCLFATKFDLVKGIGVWCSRILLF